MTTAILQMFLIVALGVALRLLRPGGLEAGNLRGALSGLVFNLLLPVLVLDVLWQAELGRRSFAIAGLAALGVFTGLSASALACRLCRAPRPVAGALLLASAFPNATYLGLPVLEALFGARGRSVAIQYDLFACTPLLLTLGAAVAQRFGDRVETRGPLARLLRVPPLWAALAGVLLNLGGVPRPALLAPVLASLGGAVVPLMLLAIGLSLYWPKGTWRRLWLTLNPLLVQLLLMPLVVALASLPLGLEPWVRTATVLEAGMPAMVIGILFCDRYGLDSKLYALTVTLTTLASLLTLPLWVGWLGT